MLSGNCPVSSAIFLPHVHRGIHLYLNSGSQLLYFGPEVWYMVYIIVKLSG